MDNEYQVEALVGENRFGPGSVIIVTSRNEHLLTRFAVHVKYEAKLLTQDESLQLFSWNAFRTIHPPDDYAELSNDVLIKVCWWASFSSSSFGCFFVQKKQICMEKCY